MKRSDRESGISKAGATGEQKQSRDESKTSQERKTINKVAPASTKLAGSSCKSEGPGRGWGGWLGGCNWSSSRRTDTAPKTCCSFQGHYGQR